MKERILNKNFPLPKIFTNSHKISFFCEATITRRYKNGTKYVCSLLQTRPIYWRNLVSKRLFKNVILTLASLRTGSNFVVHEQAINKRCPYHGSYHLQSKSCAETVSRYENGTSLHPKRKFFVDRMDFYLYNEVKKYIWVSFIHRPSLTIYSLMGETWEDTVSHICFILIPVFLNDKMYCFLPLIRRIF